MFSSPGSTDDAAACAAARPGERAAGDDRLGGECTFDLDRQREVDLLAGECTLEGERFFDVDRHRDRDFFERDRLLGGSLVLELRHFLDGDFLRDADRLLDVEQSLDCEHFLSADRLRDLFLDCESFLLRPDGERCFDTIPLVIFDCFCEVERLLAAPRFPDFEPFLDLERFLEVHCSDDSERTFDLAPFFLTFEFEHDLDLFFNFVGFFNFERFLDLDLFPTGEAELFGDSDLLFLSLETHFFGGDRSADDSACADSEASLDDALLLDAADASDAAEAARLLALERWISAACFITAARAASAVAKPSTADLCRAAMEEDCCNASSRAVYLSLAAFSAAMNFCVAAAYSSLASSRIRSASLACSTATEDLPFASVDSRSKLATSF